MTTIKEASARLVAASKIMRKAGYDTPNKEKAVKNKPFKWPPTWPHVQPKVKKHYRHEVTVASSENADYAYTLYFTSEKKARQFMNAAKESTNDVQTEYERKELPTFNEERIET